MPEDRLNIKISRDFQPVLEELAEQAGIFWGDKPSISGLLAAIASGEVPFVQLSQPEYEQLENIAAQQGIKAKELIKAIATGELPFVRLSKEEYESLERISAKQGINPSKLIQEWIERETAEELLEEDGSCPLVPTAQQGWYNLITRQLKILVGGLVVWLSTEESPGHLSITIADSVKLNRIDNGYLLEEEFPLPEKEEQLPEYLDETYLKFVEDMREAGFRVIHHIRGPYVEIGRGKYKACYEGPAALCKDLQDAIRATVIRCNWDKEETGLGWLVYPRVKEFN